MQNIEVIDSYKKVLDFIKNDKKDIPANWKVVDQIYTILRRKLFKTGKWRYSPQFVRKVAMPIQEKLSQYHLSVEGKVYCDFGCGNQHPYGTSIVMYINGAVSTIATDLQEIKNKERAAEAIYDLLLDCLAYPEDYHYSTIKKQEYLNRIHSFNLKALREGNLETGLAGLPIKHITNDIHQTKIQEGSIDILSSHTVLEHVLDFEIASQKIYSLMSPGGIQFHKIDLADHRARKRNSKYHLWSFLAEDENWTKDKNSGTFNRLRSSEFKQIFQRTGFEILEYQTRKAMKKQMTSSFREKLKGRFASMSDEELSIVSVFCFLKKPE